MPIIRPARVSSEELTPEVVSRHGWRDDRYQGDDACSRCGGWGTMPNDRVPDEGWVTFRTCAKCLGTGRDRAAVPPTKGKAP